MGGSVLAAMLIISIGEWRGAEALHCSTAGNSFVARISHKLEKNFTVEKETVGLLPSRWWVGVEKLFGRIPFEQHFSLAGASLTAAV